MKKFFLLIAILFAGNVHLAYANSVKLPYEKGERFVVVQGYNTLPTHINKDLYAIDFSQNDCDAYGKAAVAAFSGKVIFAADGYNGGYGSEVLVQGEDHLIARYAHLILGSIVVQRNDVVSEGDVLGDIGNTGLVAGAACENHPGTHIHFAIYHIDAQGDYIAQNPEPISGYTDITPNDWYLSDNERTAGDLITMNPIQGGVVLAASSSICVLPSAATSSTVLRTSSTFVNTASASVPLYGSVSVSPTSPPILNDATTSISNENLSPSNPDEALISQEVTSSPQIIFTQPMSEDLSVGSWYDDSWYDLGTGFAGTLQSLTLRLSTPDSEGFAGHITLQEYKDANYENLTKEFSIGDGYFGEDVATTTFDNLSIQLKPYFYYRLATIEDRQNRNVRLAGNVSTGTAMYDNFVFGTGRVEYQYSFSPFMIMEGSLPISSLGPPPLTPPTNLFASFDELGLTLQLSWNPSVDPDWSGNPLHYEVAYTTSTTLDGVQWISPVTSIPVVPGNTYTIGLRARDNFGAVSVPAMMIWSFPSDFVLYHLSDARGSFSQSFAVDATDTLQSITVYANDFSTESRNPAANNCVLSFFDGASGKFIANALSGYSGDRCGGPLIFPFDSSSTELVPAHQYLWTFETLTGNPTTHASAKLYETPNDTFRFVVQGEGGALFKN